MLNIYNYTSLLQKWQCCSNGSPTKSIFSLNSNYQMQFNMKSSMMDKTICNRLQLFCTATYSHPNCKLEQFISDWEILQIDLHQWFCNEFQVIKWSMVISYSAEWTSSKQFPWKLDTVVTLGVTWIWVPLQCIKPAMGTRLEYPTHRASHSITRNIA